MTDRSIRRAAERKAVKAARKAQRVSDAQLTANRANAQLAHGAVTPEGQAISSRNHTIHGLTAVPCEDFKVLPNENQAAYDKSLADYRKEWNPTTATEHDLVLRLVTHTWLIKRAVRLQNEILAAGEIIDPEDRRNFALYMRYDATHTRAYSKALSEIMRLRNFQMSQRKNEAILERRQLDTANRFESQKQRSELHTIKLQLLEQRTHRPAKPTEQPMTQGGADNLVDNKSCGVAF